MRSEHGDKRLEFTAEQIAKARVMVKSGQMPLIKSYAEKEALRRESSVASQSRSIV
jgi:hypothetical protein